MKKRKKKSPVTKKNGKTDDALMKACGELAEARKRQVNVERFLLSIATKMRDISTGHCGAGVPYIETWLISCADTITYSVYSGEYAPLDDYERNSE